MTLRTFLPRILTAYGLLALGFSFYASKFPERCCAGTTHDGAGRHAGVIMTERGGIYR